MIKANELRVGNIVRNIATPDIEEFYAYVVSIEKNTVGISSNKEDLAGMNVSLDDPQGVEPIPLTPEILEKLKFYSQGPVRIIHWHFEYYVKDKHIAFKSTKRVFTLKVKNSSFYYLNAYEVRTLHQLQNLYFALTGEELEIQL